MLEGGASVTVCTSDVDRDVKELSGTLETGGPELVDADMLVGTGATERDAASDVDTEAGLAGVELGLAGVEVGAIGVGVGVSGAGGGGSELDTGDVGTVLGDIGAAGVDVVVAGIGGAEKGAGGTNVVEVVTLDA